MVHNRPRLRNRKNTLEYQSTPHLKKNWTVIKNLLLSRIIFLQPTQKLRNKGRKSEISNWIKRIQIILQNEAVELMFSQKVSRSRKWTKSLEVNKGHQKSKSRGQRSKNSNFELFKLRQIKHQNGALDLCYTNINFKFPKNRNLWPSVTFDDLATFFQIWSSMTQNLKFDTKLKFFN